MYCKKCGKMVEDDISFCPYCGAALKEADNEYKKGKSLLGAGLLALFLGCLGIHNFYLGYNGKAIAQLLLTILGGLIFGIGPIISGIWAFIEAILIFMGKIPDSTGCPLN